MPARRKCRSDTGKPAGSMMWAATSKGKHKTQKKVAPGCVWQWWWACPPVADWKWAVIVTTASSAEHPTRRDFLFVATGCAAAVGGVATLWPFVSQMNPDASTIAAGAPIEVDLAPIASGQDIKVFWRGKPIYISHRTKKQIDEARQVPVSSLPDPQPDHAPVREG